MTTSASSDDGTSTIESRPLSSYEDLFARSAPYLGMTCQWLRLSRKANAKRGGGSCAQNSDDENAPCSPDEIVAALQRVHRRIVPLRCVLEKLMKDEEEKVVLVAKNELEPDITLVDFDGTPMTDEADSGSHSDADEQDIHLLLEKLAAKEVSEGFGPTADCYHNRPLWRAKVLPSRGWVVASFHHAICDGSSRKLFTAELMNAFESEVDDGDVYKLHPGVGDLLNTALEKRNEQVEPPKNENSEADTSDSSNTVDADPKPQCWPQPDTIAPLTERSIQAPSVAIPHASRLRDAARSHDGTVTALILAALAMAIRNQMEEVDKLEPIAVTPMRIGVDVRRHLSVEQPFGCYVTSGDIDTKIPIKVDEGIESIWDMVRHISSDILKAATLDNAACKSQELRATLDVPLTPEVLTGIIGMINGPTQGRDCPANLSNIGVVQSESPGGTIHMDRLFSVTSQTSMGCYAFVNAATVSDQLCVTLGSVHPIVSEERGRAMLEDFCATVKKVMAE